ncbi:MAG: hypothetical protein NUV69_00615 [Candidatus Curtissbacteria bacterium]|nr:hypothetical protein [Candidatus Curtissbacteria bacterium]
MDPRSQEYLDKILTKEPEALNASEIGFLRARRSYLKKAQLEEYDSVLNPKAPKAKDQTSEESETVKKNAKSK